MKTHSKSLKLTTTIAAIVSVTLLGSLPTLALPDTTTPTKPSAACTRVATLEATATAALSTKLAAMNNNFTARLTKLDERKATIDQQITAAREKAAGNFDTSIEKMLERNLSDNQKQAVTTFQTNMKTAEKTREEAVDAARATYRTSLASAVKSHQTSLTNAATTYQTTVKTAFATAKTNCDQSTALATLRSSIKTARATYKQSREDLHTTSTAAIKAFMTTRNDAIKTANETFAKTVSEQSQILQSELASTN